MIEVLWFILFIVAFLIGLMVIGLLGALVYYIGYSVYCLVTGKPNRLNKTEELFDTKPEDNK